ncbi:hypothetical protein BDV96DRAFT_482722 [Lophiotrema nucula]|uniref:F-box domain-containing protein n=1 Tax=Lophiotrema nucula TaxID=690887 RepID=A0A6A5ZS52_9PLEO|nr:hypothetical protein BDV96DRAFT_482722 [Lophiotrema nucula]
MSSSPQIKAEPVPELQCPSLPAEIWIRILSYHEDLTHLWTTCRLVSHTYRDYVEQMFAEHHLRNTYIDWPLEKYNLGGKSKRPEVTACFSRFEFEERRTTGKRKKNGQRKAGKEKTKLLDKVMERWEDRVKASNAETPNYTIRLYGVVNDTPLPDLVFDMQRKEIGFDWRAMYTAFFREQARLHELKERWRTECDEKEQKNRVQLAKGEKISVEDLPKSWPVVEVELKKKIRRARLKEHFKDDEEMKWAIDSLQYFEDYSKAATFKLLPDIPGAGVGEKWFGSMNLLQGLYLDEWSSMHRIDTKVEHLAQEARK